MLKALIARIAHHERMLDERAEENGKQKLSKSSFSPCDYPPREKNGRTVTRKIETLDDDELYLPCHYFTLVGGTSTGGYDLSFLSWITVADLLRD